MLRLISQEFFSFPSKYSKSDTSREVRSFTTEKSQLSIERAKALLRKKGIDIDDPQWRAQLDKLDDLD